MSDPVTIAIIAALGSLLVAWIGYLWVRLQRLEARERALWLWTRELVDHAYRYSDVDEHPLPAPPAFLRTDS